MKGKTMKPPFAKGKMPQGFKNGGAAFKPCAGCPNPAKCKMAGKCMKKK